MSTQEFVSRRLSGKRAAVTGGASGIGLATVKRFVEEGAAVAMLDIDAPALDAASEALRSFGASDVVPIICDVSDESSVEAAFEDVLAKLGGLDVVVANAGVQLHGRDAPVHLLDKAIWDKTLDVNLTGVFLTCKYGVRPLLLGQGGSVIMTGSIVGLRGGARTYEAYSASKGGVFGLMRVMANDYGPDGIRVNAVAPGFTDTPLIHDHVSADRATELISKTPLRRQGQPEESAAVIAFLASDDASFVTGATYLCDGGMDAV